MSALWHQQPTGIWQLQGRVDYASAPQLASTYQPAESADWCIDLSQAEGGSALLLVLLACQRKARAAQHRLLLVQPSGHLLGLLDLTGLHGFFQYDPTRQGTKVSVAASDGMR